MKKFNLYQSGILFSKIFLKDDSMYHSKLNVFSLSFESEKSISNLDIEEYKKYFNIDLDKSFKILSMFETNPLVDSVDSFELENELYQKHKDYKNIYVAMSAKFPLDIICIDNSVVGFIVPSRDAVTVFIEEGFEDHTIINLWKKELAYNKINPIKEIKRIDIEMRDGVKLASEFIIPNVEGKTPTILIRTPYNRCDKISNYYKYVLRGYVVCVQDVRGKNDSEGEFIPKCNETNDGDDTIKYISSQEWSNGDVGMIGASYLGYVQWSAAASGNKNLKALISIVTSGNAFKDLPRKGGTFSSGVLAWAFSVGEQVFNKDYMVRDDWDDIIKIRPIKDIPKKVLGKEINFWNAWCSHEKYDEFWDKTNWHSKKDKIKTPAMIVSGWFDDNGDATSLAIDVVKDYEDKDKKIILGPWLHNGNNIRTINGVRFGTDALLYDIDLIFIKWFEKKLKGIDNNIEEMPTVNYYAVGKNEWITSDKWFPEYAKETKYYISNTKPSNSSSGGGILSKEEPKKEYTDTYIFNPNDTAKHLIDISENEICVPANYKDEELRDDILIYTSIPFEKETTIVGDITVVFYAKSTAKDTDWVVRVTDVDENNNSIRLADGILRAKFRFGFDKIVLLEEDKIEKYEIVTTKIANTFKKGHRIRLQITSGAENYIFPNHNTGNNMFEDIEMIECRQTIVSSSVYPSYIVLSEF